MDSGINTLTNKGIKDIITANGSLENKGILLKGTTEKIISQGGESFCNYFLDQLMKFGSPLMKNIFTSLTKCVLMPLGLTAAASTTDAAIRKNYGSVMSTLII